MFRRDEIIAEITDLSLQKIGGEAGCEAGLKEKRITVLWRSMASTLTRPGKLRVHECKLLHKDEVMIEWLKSKFRVSQGCWDFSRCE